MRKKMRMADFNRVTWTSLFLLVFLVMIGPSSVEALDLFTFRVEKSVRLGKARPTLTVFPDADFKSVSFTGTRSDGAVVRTGGKPATRGKPVLLTWDQPEGEQSYEGVISGVYPNGEQYDVPVSFTVFVGGPLGMTVPRDRIDLAKGTLELTLSRAAGKVELVVQGPDGPLVEETAAFSGEAAGTPLTVHFSARGEVLRLDIKGYDQWGFFATEEISPWTLDIPHEDVVFATGSSVIEGSEEPKLERAWQQVRDAVEKYGRIVNVKLFVAGYTDTVGDRGSNQTLSEARARSIATWFRRKGFSGSLSYQGFGEDGLAVATEDGAPEIRNRRAAYVLAAQTLPTSSAFPRGAWRPIP